MVVMCSFATLGIYYDYPGISRSHPYVIFVVDRSGSMSGKKIEQARNALRFVLNNLREGDLFNIVAYDSDVESFKPELEKYTDKTRKEALEWVEKLWDEASASGKVPCDFSTIRALFDPPTEPTPSA